MKRFVTSVVLAIAACAMAAGCAAGSRRAVTKNERIVFLGDSITAAGVWPGGYVRLTAGTLAELYPDLNVTVFGAGVVAHKVTDCQLRLQRDVLSRKPTIVVIYIGINDVWHSKDGAGTSREEFDAGLREMIKRINEVGARVILCTPTVIGEKTGGANRFDKMLDEYSDISRKVANETGSQLLDLRKAFVTYIEHNNPSNKEAGILTADRVHLNVLGNRFVATLMLEALGVPPKIARAAVLPADGKGKAGKAN